MINMDKFLSKIEIIRWENDISKKTRVWVGGSRKWRKNGEGTRVIDWKEELKERERICDKNKKRKEAVELVAQGSYVHFPRWIKRERLVIYYIVMLNLERS